MAKISKNKKKNDELDEHPEDGGKLSPGPGKESFKLAQFWKSQINAYEEATRRWFKRGNMVVKRYRDERNRIDEEGQRRMNLLWSNVKVMKPAIYSKCPIPIVDRKFLDKDPTGRLSSQILERSVKNELDSNGFHEGMNAAVMDMLLPGRGELWVRYEPKIGQGPSLPSNTINGVEDPLYDIGEETGDTDLTDLDETEEKLETTGEQVIAEKAIVDYVDWRDFYLFPPKARTWAEVQAVGKKTYISKKQAIERFGDKIGKSLKPDTTPFGSGDPQRLTYSDTSIFQDINERSIEIYEIWNKSDERVYWISSGYEYLCDVMDDPLELTGFFPVPPPLSSTMTNDTLIPIPDYIEWQDQAIQIDELTQRLSMLSKACKVAGVYSAANPQISRIFNESVENELIPVDQWAMFAESGGLKGAIDFIPIDQIQTCIETLQKVRQQAMVDLDQITGLSDVMRGTSDSRETLGGLRLKNNNAGTRLSENQEEVAKFARNVIRLVSEVVCKHFSDETIIESSGILYEDALQPDTLMREWETEHKPASPNQHQMPPQAMPNQHQMPPGMPPQAPQQPAQPQIAPPQPAQPQNNVVPFPGTPGQPQQPPPQQPPTPLIPQEQPPSPEILALMKVTKAIDLLRKDVTRNYRIDIETDSTIYGDKYQERQDATEFVTALGGFFKQFESVGQAEPASLPLLAKTLQWAVRKYRTGRDLEAEIDNFVDLMTKKAKQLAENPPPSPEMMKANAEIQQMQLEGKIQAENDQRDFQKQQANDQREAQIQASDDQREQQQSMLEMELQKMKLQNEKEKMEMEMQMAREQHAMEMQALRANTQADLQKHAIDVHSQKLELHNKEEEHKIDKKELKHKDELHNQKQRHQKTEQNKKHKDKMNNRKAS